MLKPKLKKFKPYSNQKNQIFIILVLVPIRCSESAEPFAVTCSKAHSAKLHRWRVDGYLYKFDRLDSQTVVRPKIVSLLLRFKADRIDSVCLKNVIDCRNRPFEYSPIW